MKAVLFDMDGVIINSRIEIEEFWQKWAKIAGGSFSFEEIEQFIHGCPVELTLNQLFNHTPHLWEDIKMDSANLGLHPEKMVMKGFFDFIDYLDEYQIPYGIVTSHVLKNASRIVNSLGIQNRIKALVTADQVERGKPYPDPYLLGAERLGIPNKEIIVFEDSLSGIQSAHNAGSKVIGINLPHFRNSLLIKGAHDVLEDFVLVKKRWQDFSLLLIR
jgi:beta-phosphoglucomutase-like phosphatase (HAD superfamily)